MREWIIPNTASKVRNEIQVLVHRDLLSMPRPAIHFIGFRTSTQVYNATKIWGPPDIWHRHWDARAQREFFPEIGDVAIFAKGTEHDPIEVYTFDDSSFF